MDLPFRSKGLGLKALAFLLAVSPLNAAPLYESPDPDVTLAHLPDKVWTDLGGLFTPDQALVAGLGGSLTAADWVFFDPSNPWPQDLRAWGTPGLWDFGDFYGQGWVEGFGGVGCWAWGGLTGDHRLACFGRDASESLAMATLLVTGLKYAVGRERPDGSNHFSFPSGHTITAFCVAPVVAKYGGWELGVPAYALAAVTGLSRVEGEHHYLSDVLAGATLGILLGDLVVERPKDLSLSPTPGGAQVTWSFN
ncbi:MAG TPA: phosphatase PAP2 family protein [bacterium]|nr:phosphatase PAP2 family protein [bacterium]